jgi:hypothetical protein
LRTLENSSINTLPTVFESQIIEIDNLTCAICVSTDAGANYTMTMIELQIPYEPSVELEFPVRITNYSNIDGSASDTFDIDQNKLFRIWKHKFITEAPNHDFGLQMTDLYPLYKVFREMKTKVQQPTLRAS